jgi:hypothetical protein
LQIVIITGTLTFTNATLDIFITPLFESYFIARVNTSGYVLSASYSYAQTASRRRLMSSTTQSVVASYRITTYAGYAYLIISAIEALLCSFFGILCTGTLLISTPQVSVYTPPSPTPASILPLAVGIPVGIVGGAAAILGGAYLWTKSQRRKQFKKSFPRVDGKKLDNMKL